MLGAIPLLSAARENDTRLRTSVDLEPATHLFAHLNQRWIKAWNEDPEFFVWTKTADQILDTLAAHCTRISDSRQLASTC